MNTIQTSLTCLAYLYFAIPDAFCVSPQNLSKNSPTCKSSETKENVTLQDGVKAGKFTNKGIVNDMKTCVDRCCQHQGCDLAFKLGTVCYAVHCKSADACIVLPAKEPNSFGRVDIARVHRDNSANSGVAAQPTVDMIGKLAKLDNSRPENTKKVTELVKRLHNVNEPSTMEKINSLQIQNGNSNFVKDVKSDSDHIEKDSKADSDHIEKDSKVDSDDIEKDSKVDSDHIEKDSKVDQPPGSAFTTNVSLIEKLGNRDVIAIGNKVYKNYNQSPIISKAAAIAEENSKKKCILRPPAYNQTIIGGLRRREEVKDMGLYFDVEDCAEKCCQRETCKAAVIHAKKCFAVQCRTKGYCDSQYDPPLGGSPNVIVYMKSRDDEAQDRRERCRRRCGHGTCLNDKNCLCDSGSIDEYCDEAVPVCSPQCGPHGSCDAKDLCLCEPGWEGPTCLDKIICDPPCRNGICVNARRRECKCPFGLTGMYCHRNNGDKSVVASTGEQVLFTQAEVEPELAIKIPAEKPPLSERSEPVNAFTVAACCAMASLFLGIVAVSSMMRRFVKKRNALTREYLEKSQLIN